MPNPTCVNNIEIKKAKLLATALTIFCQLSNPWFSISDPRHYTQRCPGIIVNSCAHVINPRHPLSVFNDAILDHFRNPRNAGDLPDATATVDVTNPVCGDVLRLAVRLDAEGCVSAARFRTQGCVAAIACSSALTDMLIGKSAAEISAITPQQISSQPRRFATRNLSRRTALHRCPRRPPEKNQLNRATARFSLRCRPATAGRHRRAPSAPSAHEILTLRG